MPLRKANAELLMVKGIEQKVSDYVIPDESLAVATNVDFSKVGAAKKREGFVENSNLVLGAGILDEVRRLGVRQRREVLCITETVTQIGSAAGVGNAGDTLFSYSEEAQRWIVRGKMPRPNVDILWTSGAAGVTGSNNDFVCGGAENFVCIAHRVDAYDVRVVIFDVGGEVNATLREAPTIVLETTFRFQEQAYLAGWGQAGGKVWLFYGYPINSVSIAIYSAARCFDPSTMTFGPEVVINDRESVYAVSSNGTDIYLAFGYGVGGYEIRRVDGNLGTIGLQQYNSLLLPNQEIALDGRGGWVDVARRDLDTGNVYVSRHEESAVVASTLDQLITPVPGSVDGLGNLQIVTVSDSNAVVLWGNSNTSISSSVPAYTSVGLVNMYTASLLGYFNHQGIIPYAQPFIIDGRVFFFAMHTTGYVYPGGGLYTGSVTGEESFMCFQIPIDNMNSDNVPLPVAQWDYGFAVCKQVNLQANGSLFVSGHTIYQDGSGVYVLTAGASVAGQSVLDWLPMPRLARLEFGDSTHRWRHDEAHDYAMFAGGVPFCYDGTRAYELSTALHCPTPISWEAVAGGTLPVDEEVFFRAAMLYVDGNGRESWSQPSRIISVTPTMGFQTAQIVIAPVTSTMKPDMGNSAIGRMKLYLFMATRNAPNEYQVAAVPREIYPQQLDPVGFFVTESVPPGNSQMYTGGFELDNFPAPPCRALAVHSGRVFVIASDSNQVCYSKPFRSDRAIEFALGQEIPLPDKGTALASINDRLAVFTHRAIYVVGGDGPDVTGDPPTGFSRPALISSDYGCIEYCAAGRTPMGIIFRGQQGFYLLTMGFDVQYIGGPVEDLTRNWVATRSIVHDQRSGCCRITGYTGDETQELCYWYDTKRWSLNEVAEVVDSIALGDNLLVGVADTSVAVASRFRLGTRASPVSYQDHGESYDQTIETGWVSFQQVGVFKRVWRVYALVRSANASARVRIQVWKDWEERVSSDREFELDQLDSEPQNLRVHLKHQKIKAIKVRVTITSDGAGAHLMKVGFELGTRTGGPKEVREQTQ